MQHAAYEELKPDADDPLVFVDDTGDETFAGNQGFLRSRGMRRSRRGLCLS
jgi:hypothetical protein